MLPPIVMWIDPGLDTGIARLFNSSQMWAMELKFMPAAGEIERTCATYGEMCWVGWEKFKIGPRTPPIDAHHAIEMIGVTRLMAQRYKCRILPAANPDQRHVATMAKLKKLNWWVPGQDDSQSAAQHLLAYLLRSNEAPPFVRETLNLTGRVS